MAVNRSRAGTVSVAITAAVVVVLVGVNILASRATQAVDLTHGGLNTLAPQSVLAAKRLQSDLLVIGLFRPGSGNGQAEAEALIGLYAAQSPRIVYRRENVDTDLADVNHYKVKEANTIVLDYRGKTQLLTPVSQNEVGFTAALIKLQSDRTPLVCWAAGDGERSLKDTDERAGYSSFADVLANNSFATRDLLLSQASSIPADCDEVAIIAPAKPLPTSTVKAMDDYLAGGGKLLLAADPWPQDPAAVDSVNAVIKTYGLALSGGLVVEPDPSRAAAQDPTIPAVVDYGVSPITRGIKGLVSFFPQTTSITVAEPAPAVALIAMTSGTSYVVARPRPDPQKRQAGDAGGPFVIMAAVERQAGAKVTRIVVVGTAAFAENRTLPPRNSDANIELALGSVQWLAEQDSLISIPPKPGRSLPLALTQQDQSTMIFITSALMPGLIVFAGVMVWWRRRVFS